MLIEIWPEEDAVLVYFPADAARWPDYAYRVTDRDEWRFMRRFLAAETKKFGPDPPTTGCQERCVFDLEHQERLFALAEPYDAEDGGAG